MSEAPFAVFEVPADVFREDEYLGTKFKFWFHDPARPGRRVLFKRGRANEDWSEKVATEVAHALGLPAAEVDLAIHEGAPGIVSPSFLEPSEQLFHGNELLLEVQPGYQSGRRYHVGEHTVQAVFQALEQVEADPHPGGAPLPEGLGATDQFVGYLMLDALVSNTDRHHENWGVVQAGPRRFLAPTYDHASSLGRNERPERLERRLRGRDPRVTVAAYVKKGRSALYEPGVPERPLSTLDAFARAAALRPRAARAWADRLAALPEPTFARILARVPSERICPLHREFAARMLVENRRRIAARVQGELRA